MPTLLQHNGSCWAMYSPASQPTVHVEVIAVIIRGGCLGCAGLLNIFLFFSHTPSKTIFKENPLTKLLDKLVSP